MGLVGIEPGTQVLLIRHGETQWNVDNRVQGHLDVPLTERGEEQARRLRDWLDTDALDAIYASDLSRAYRTAELLAEGRGLAAITESRLREARFGVFEGLTATEIAAAHPEAYHLWRTDAIRNRPPGGETLEELHDRCMEALQEHLPKHPGQTVAVVAHGGPVRIMLVGLLDLSLEVYPKIRVENTSVSRVLFTAKGAILAGANDTGHLRSSAAAPKHAGWEEK